MKPETVELIHLIGEAKDKEKAILTAFAIILDHISPNEPSSDESDVPHHFVDQKCLLPS
jgi:hypothetical protein